MLLEPIPTIIRTDVLARRVEQRIAPFGLTCAHFDDAPLLRTIPGTVGICLTDGTLIASEQERTIVWQTSKPSGPLRYGFLVMPHELPSVRFVPRHSAVFTIPADLSDVPRWVIRSRLTAWQESLIDAVRHYADLPLVLRVALTAILKQPIAHVHAAVCPVRTVSRVAGMVGVTREHLSRMATDYGLDIPLIADINIATIAIVLHNFEGSSWDSVAWRLGYRSQAGLHALLRRGLRCGLRQAAQEDVEALLLRVEGELAARLQASRTDAVGAEHLS